MVQEPGQVSIHGDSPAETVNVHKVAHRKLKGHKLLQSKGLQQLEEEHWQRTSVRREKSSVIHSHRSDVQENDDGFRSPAPPKPELNTHCIEEVVAQSTLDCTPPRLGSSAMVTQSKTKPIETTHCTDDLTIVEKSIVTGSNSKCAMEIPRLELTKEIPLQAKLEAGAYVCQECQVVVATSRGEIGFHRRYPFLLFFCIFLNLMSILSFLFCISVLRTIFPNPAY